MSNIYPPMGDGNRIIPERSEERPVRHLNGQLFTHDAYHCRAEHLWPKGVKEAKDEWLRPINVYLANFCEPIRSIADEIKCVSCDFQVTGHHVGLQNWRHKNALTYDPNGTMEGRCNQCGYPCRLDHNIMLMPSRTVLVHLKGFPLFYHPSATLRSH